METKSSWDFLSIAKERFPTRDLTIVPVAMKEWAHVIMDKNTCENVADILYDYNGGKGYSDTLFGYKYRIKWLMKSEKDGDTTSGQC